MGALILLMLLSGFGCHAYVNMLSPAGEAVSLPDGAAVVISADAGKTEEFAAGLLSEYLEKITGDKFPVCRGTAPEPFIQLLPPCPPGSELGEVGYSIEECDGNWYISGGSRSGPVSGVLALLEEDAGCRWYAPGETPVIPSVPELAVVPRSFVPVFQVRDPFFFGALNDPVWAGFNRTNPYFLGGVAEEFGGRFRYSSRYFTHTFYTLIPMTLGEEHPEYFPLIGGKRIIKNDVQRCLASPELVDLVADELMREKERTPEVTVYGVAQNDAYGGWCECPVCSKQRSEEGNSGHVLLFVNAVADKVAERYPDMMIATLAYHTTFTPPVSVRPRDNVVIMLCTDSHALNCGQFFPITEETAFYDALHGWSDLDAHIQIWDYVVDFKNYPLPQPNLSVMDANIDLYMKCGAIGIMMQGNYQSPGASLEALKSWVLAKKLWDPSRSMTELSEDFIIGYYGAAAPAMLRYVELQMAWRDEMATGAPRKLLLPAEFVDEALELLAEARNACAGDTAALRKVMLEEFSVRYLRAHLGVRGPEDVPAYEDNIQKLAQMRVDFDITNMSESGKNEVNFDNWRRRVREAGMPALYSSGTLRPFPELMTAKPEEAEDATSATGIALRQPGQNPEWSIQYKYEYFLPEMTADDIYVLRLRWRIEPIGGVQWTEYAQAFTIGLYSPVVKSFAECTTVSAGPENLDYNWTIPCLVEIAGREATGCIYLAAFADAPLSALWYDGLELIPLNEYADDLPPELPVLKIM